MTTPASDRRTAQRAVLVEWTRRYAVVLIIAVLLFVVVLVAPTTSPR